MSDLWARQAGCQLFVAIPTNGDVRADGLAVMGAGLALQAAERFPDIPKRLGQLLQMNGNVPFVFNEARVVTFPTKPSWQDPAVLALIEITATRLTQLQEVYKGLRPILMPRVGCGAGRLTWAKVRPVLDAVFKRSPWNCVEYVDP